MFTKKLLVQIFSVLLVVALLSGSASARPLDAALGTGFSYQGKLTEGGAPANRMYDLQFKLYNDLSIGTQVGSTLAKEDVTVTAGLFTVQLDFGNVFDGTALYLEIGVRPGASTGAYTPLTPRQQLTATPYAIFASKAPWSGLTGVPSGFADGVDNGSAYQNVKVVAKSGGDYTTITAALNAITDASDTNRYLIQVAPGVYTERVTMKEYVDIEGSGELTTKITFSGSPATDTGTVLGANNAELRFLTVENTGVATIAVAIYNYSAGPRLIHVTASASGGSVNYGVYTNIGSPTMTHVTASASGGDENYCVANVYSSPTMTDVSASASGGTSNNVGVRNYSSSTTMTNVTVSATGGMYSYGVTNYDSSPTMTNVTATASGGTNANNGVANTNSSSPTMTNVTASASGGTESYGVYNSNSSPTMMNVTATGTGPSGEGGAYCYGVMNNSSSAPTMTNVIATGLGGVNQFGYGVYNYSSSPTMTNVTASGSGGGASFGVVNNVSSSPTMTEVTASATGGSNGAFGVRNDNNSAPTINNSVISASGGANNYGLYNSTSSTSTVRVNNSQISASTNTIRNDAGSTTFIGASQLNGGAVTGGGTLTCAGVYDENYVFSASTCP